MLSPARKLAATLCGGLALATSLVAVTATSASASTAPRTTASYNSYVALGDSYAREPESSTSRPDSAFVRTTTTVTWWPPR